MSCAGSLSLNFLAEINFNIRLEDNFVINAKSYSTVIKGSTNILQGKGYSLRLSVQLVSPNLWVPPYTNYQQELFDIITKFHEVDGWNFKMISDWLVKNNYLTPRGTIFNQPKCWSIYKKKKRSVSRFTRSFNHTITGMSIDVVDYTPNTIN
jgi:hypothetical protein